MPIYNDAAVQYDEATYQYDDGSIGLTIDADDTLSLSDAVAKAVGLAPTETLSLSDAISKAIGAGLSEAALVLVDAQGNGVEIAKADTLSLADSVSAGFLLSQVVNDMVMQTELYNDSSITYNQVGFKYDGASADSVSLLVQFYRAFADSASLSDLASNLVVKNFSDTLAVSDSVSVVIGFSRKPELYATLVFRPKTASFNLVPKLATVQTT